VRLIVVTGVSGCGKSAAVTTLAGRVNKSFIDADDYYPKVNLENMSIDIPLDDEDRWQWLESIGKALGHNCKREGIEYAPAIPHFAASIVSA
jgi:gluconokinase